MQNNSFKKRFLFVFGPLAIILGAFFLLDLSLTLCSAFLFSFAWVFSLGQNSLLKVIGQKNYRFSFLRAIFFIHNKFVWLFGKKVPKIFLRSLSPVIFFICWYFILDYADDFMIELGFILFGCVVGEIVLKIMPQETVEFD